MTRPKILIVDDEPFNVDYLEQELEDEDYETISASNGPDALDKLQFDAPDLVLLDVMMPVMDGFEVLSRLKANPTTRNIPVIIISASNDLQSVVRGIQLGAEDYLPKPFEPILLRARISSSLEKKRLHELEQAYVKSLEREMDIAREIQMGFLPPQLPHVEGWELGAYFKAAREVAGDFYDAFVLSSGHLVCVIGDVCGKGVGAALFMTLFRSLIRATLTTDMSGGGRDMKSSGPAELLQQMVTFTNRYVAETHADANMFATAFIGIFNAQDGMLTYVNCGNDPPWLLSEGRALTSLRPTGPALGVIPDARFTVKEVPMEENDVLLAFTDGVPDALNSEGDYFGKERLPELLTKTDTTPAALLDNVKTQLSVFMSTAEQFDDITLLAVKRLL